MLVNKYILSLLLICYLGITTFFYITNIKQVEPVTFFTKDADVPANLHIAISSDINTHSVLLTRFFHNKLFSYLNQFDLLVYRSLDIPTLYSLTDLSTNESKGNLHMLFPFELFFFVPACFIFIKKWEKLKRRYTILFIITGVSIVLCGLFIPTYSVIKMFPLLVSLRLITFFGMLELIKENMHKYA